MSNVTARYKAKGKHYEIRVNLDEALKIQKGNGDITQALDSPGIYHDLDKGTAVSNSDLMDVFGSTDLYEVATKIIQKGEVQKNQEFRDTEREQRIKQVVNLIIKNAVDQNGKPYTEERIKRAIEEVHYQFTNQPSEQQVAGVIEKIKTVIPIRIETKKIKLTIPAQYTGAVYAFLKDYKEKEDWQDNGSLVVTVNVPSGMQLDFFDKINSATHGSIQSEEIKPK